MRSARCRVRQAPTARRREAAPRHAAGPRESGIAGSPDKARASAHRTTSRRSPPGPVPESETRSRSGGTKNAPGGCSFRAVSFAPVAEQNAGRIALDSRGEPAQSGNQLPYLADKGADIAQRLLTETAQPRTHVLQRELELPAGFGEALGEPVEIAERCRRAVAEPIGPGVAGLDIVEQRRQRVGRRVRGGGYLGDVLV